MGGVKKRRVGNELQIFQYEQTFNYYYANHHAVDENNNNFQEFISFKGSFPGKYWNIQQFIFYLRCWEQNNLHHKNTLWGIIVDRVNYIKNNL